MKAILNPDGTFRGLVPDGAQTDASRTRVWVSTEPPVLTDSEVAESTIVIDETNATQVWQVRPKTDDEAQQTLEQLTLIERLSDAELVALEDICQPGHPARAVGLRIRAALLAAVETYSRTARTKTFIGAALQLGVVADLARAREILNDPGFTLQ